MTDVRNIADKYKNWTIDLIRDDISKNTLPYAVMMSQIEGDFNFGSVVRSANFLGAQTIYYYGKRKWDRRASVGTYLYSNVIHLDSFEHVTILKSQYKFIALENNITPTTFKMKDFIWPENSLIIIGEESTGIQKELLDICDYYVEIPRLGSVRSLNAAVAGSIAMYDYVQKR